MVVAVVGVLVLATACGDAGAGGRAPGSAEARAPRVPSAPDLPGFVAGIGFASDGSGFALLAECGRTRCRQRVAVLDRGAQAWRLGRSPLPDVTGDLGITAGLVVLGPGRALLTDGTWPAPDGTWFTGDAGRNWRRGSSEPSGSTPVVPEGGVLVEDCLRVDREDNGCERSRLAAVLPDTGEYKALATQPPLEGAVRPAGEAVPEAQSGLVGAPAEELLFASGSDPGSDRPALAVSEDRGRSWRLSPLPGAAEHGWGARVVGAARPATLYAVQPGIPPDEDDVKNGLLALYRSTDGAHTWERVWKHHKGVEPRSSLGIPIAAADGSLTVHGEAGVWRSVDGGRSFTGSGSRGLAGSVTRTPLGYLWNDSFGAGSFRISADGVHWTSFELGQGN
ncbi:exo-alpha-sialidase [Streptomyces sp. AC555_RSS877]|uniref:exo-alpha-sialidase n=1 Tax=Streptomyces sp. AC555_RSS877 TaxID=2823688 RepID=UPI001C2793C8|nr:exo-alpha-sialidase [Streptomyces sp. AC555_RSS877]